ncbi:MAG: hypothetical protein WC107_01285 [Patescibacteria group bacterium]
MIPERMGKLMRSRAYRISLREWLMLFLLSIILPKKEIHQHDSNENIPDEVKRTIAYLLTPWREDALMQMEASLVFALDKELDRLQSLLERTSYCLFGIKDLRLLAQRSRSDGNVEIALLEKRRQLAEVYLTNFYPAEPSFEQVRFFRSCFLYLAKKARMEEQEVESRVNMMIRFHAEIIYQRIIGLAIGD